MVKIFRSNRSRFEKRRDTLVGKRRGRLKIKSASGIEAEKRGE